MSPVSVAGAGGVWLPGSGSGGGGLMVELALTKTTTFAGLAED